MGCGMFITRHPAVLSEAFKVSAEFMPSSVTQLDPYLNTVQWSRRFLGLRLFLSLAAAGWDGYAVHVERAALVTSMVGELTGRARLDSRERLEACGGMRSRRRPATRRSGTSCARVLDSGRAWAAVSKYEGRRGGTRLRDPRGDLGR